MSYINEIEFDFNVGDAYEMSPIEMLYVVGKIRQQGGECVIEGNSVVVTSMPGKTTPPEAAPVEPPAPEAAPEPEIIQAPVVENEEASDEVVETPIKRARKTAAKTEEPVSDEPVPAPVEE